MISFKEFINEEMKLVNGKLAMTSKKTGKVLAYYKGQHKHSDRWFTSQNKKEDYAPPITVGE